MACHSGKGHGTNHRTSIHGRRGAGKVSVRRRKRRKRKGRRSEGGRESVLNKIYFLVKQI